MPNDNRIDQFNHYRKKMNDIILSEAPLEIKRFFSLDHQTYKEGALDEKTKELLGLATSMVLRCDDCITYHLQEAVEKGASDAELWETMAIAELVGGSIVIPHMRRAVETMKLLRK